MKTSRIERSTKRIVKEHLNEMSLGIIDSNMKYDTIRRYICLLKKKVWKSKDL